MVGNVSGTVMGVERYIDVVGDSNAVSLSCDLYHKTSGEELFCLLKVAVTLSGCLLLLHISYAALLEASSNTNFG